MSFSNTVIIVRSDTSRVFFFFHLLINTIFFFITLGTPQIIQISEDTYDCTQPPISWFGVDLIPVFVNQITKSSNVNSDSSGNGSENNDCDEHIVHVKVMDSRTNIKESSNQRGRIVNMVRNLMDQCQFRGTNIIKFHRRQHCAVVDGNNNVLKGNNDVTRANSYQWEISSELSIQLTIQLPSSRFVVLPPGFNAIGSRILRVTCAQRSKETLEGLKNAYLNWLDSRVKSNVSVDEEEEDDDDMK